MTALHAPAFSQRNALESCTIFRLGIFALTRSADIKLNQQA
jgi:hypothetical protein